MTVALHAAVLSLVVFLAVLCLRKPQRVAVTALCGCLAIAILPWFTALRPRHLEAQEKVEPRSVAAVASLPEWTVVRIPAVPAPVAKMPVSASTSASRAMVNPETFAGAIWACGGLFTLGALMVAGARVIRWRRMLAEPDESAWRAIRDAAPDAPDRTRFRISPSGGSPCVAGFFRPLVVIPSFLLDPSKQRELRWALRHELRHWRGSDSRWTVILEMARVTQWWNPFVHLLISRWKMAREHVCDLAATDEDRATYGEFLISMAAEPASRNPLAVMMVRKQRLKTLRTRIVAVLNAAPGSATPFEKGVLFSACLALIGSALMISGVRIGNEGMASTGADKETESPINLIGSAYAEEEAEPENSPVSEDAPLTVVNAEMAAQVKIQTKIIFATTDEVKDGIILTEEGLQKVMRMFAQKKGTDLMTTPSVLARTNETAMIELLREHPDDPPWKTDLKNPQLRGNRFAGWSIRFSAPYDGEKIAFTAEVACGYLRGSFPSNPEWTSPVEKTPIAWDKLVRKNATGRGRLGVGETLAISLGELEPGCFGTVFMTVTPLNAAGVSVDSYEEALSPIPQPLEGKLKLRATVLERESFPDFDMDYEINMPMYAFFITKDHWALVKKNLGVKAAPAKELAAGEVIPVPGVDIAMLSAELFKVEDAVQPRLNCWLRGDTDSFPTTPPTVSFDTSTERVEIFRLRPEKQGMTRLLFVEVEDVQPK